MSSQARAAVVMLKMQSNHAAAVALKSWKKTSRSSQMRIIGTAATTYQTPVRPNQTNHAVSIAAMTIGQSLIRRIARTERVAAATTLKQLSLIKPQSRRAAARPRPTIAMEQE